MVDKVLERFSPTFRVRFIAREIPPESTDSDVIYLEHSLQGEWKGDQGTIEWRDVPIEEDS